MHVCVLIHNLSGFYSCDRYRIVVVQIHIEQLYSDPTVHILILPAVIAVRLLRVLILLLVIGGSGVGGSLLFLLLRNVLLVLAIHIL